MLTDVPGSVQDDGVADTRSIYTKRHPPGNGRGRGVRIYSYWPVRRDDGYIDLLTEKPENAGQPFLTNLSPEDMTDPTIFLRGSQQAWLRQLVLGSIGEDAE